MNQSLKKEIIIHILNSFGLSIDNKVNLNKIINLPESNFVIQKKIAIEDDSEKKYQREIWAAKLKIENLVFKIIATDFGIDCKEYCLIFQLDGLVPHAIKISNLENDFGNFCILTKDNIWIEIDTASQGKILNGIEGLREVLGEWEIITEYSDMFKYLIGFLNFIENENN